MNAASGIISSLSGVGSASQPEQPSGLKRSLHNLGIAIQKGELAPASSILVAFFKANPQFTSPSSDDSQSPDPLTQDFQALAAAVSNNQVGAAQSVWTQIKSDLASNGVTNLGDGTTSMAEVMGQIKVSPNTPIASDTIGANSGSNASTNAAGGENAGSSNQPGLSSSLIGNGITYQRSGANAAAATTSIAGNLLNIAA